MDPLKSCKNAGCSLPCTTRICGPFSLSNSTVITAAAPFSLTDACSPVNICTYISIYDSHNNMYSKTSHNRTLWIKDTLYIEDTCSSPILIL